MCGDVIHFTRFLLRTGVRATAGAGMSTRTVVGNDLSGVGIVSLLYATR